MTPSPVPQQFAGGSSRLTIVGFDVANEPAAQQQLMSIAAAGGGQLIEVGDAASLTAALRAGVTAASWGGGGGGGSARPGSIGSGEWAALWLLVVNILLLGGLLVMRRRRGRVSPQARSRRRTGALVAALMLVHGAHATVESTALPLSTQVSVTAQRGPVLFVHGIIGSGSSFEGVAQSLRARGWIDLPVMRFLTDGRVSCVGSSAGSGSAPGLTGSTGVSGPCEDWTVAATRTVQIAGAYDPDRVMLRIEFEQNIDLPFDQQARYVETAARALRRLTGTDQVRLVGHSMGGLAARAWVQSPGYDGSVSELVTVASPHLGSLWPYISERMPPGAPSLCLPLFEAVRQLARAATRSGTVSDGLAQLSPLSPQLNALNAPNRTYAALPFGIRYVNLVAGAPEAWRCFEYFEDRLAADFTLFRLEWERLNGAAGNPVDQMYFASPQLLAKHSDLVVPVVSQTLRMVPAAQAVVFEEIVITAHHLNATDAPELVSLLDTPMPRPRTPPVPTTGEIDDVFLVMDLSSSMRERDKIGMAQRALHSVTDGLEPGTRVMLVEFGRVDCSIEEFPMFTDRTALRARIDAMAATGRTPLLLAMERTADIVRGLPQPERAAVVVVSDGADTCTPGRDPAAVARELGIALRIIAG